MQDAALLETRRVPTRGTAIAVCEPRGVFAVGHRWGYGYVSVSELPGCVPLRREAHFIPPGMRSWRPTKGQSVPDEFRYYIKSLAFTGEFHSPPFALLVAGHNEEWVHALDVDTGVFQPAFLARHDPYAIACRGPLAAVMCGTTLMRNCDPWLGLYRYSGGTWHLSDVVGVRGPRLGRLFFSDDYEGLSVVLTTDQNKIKKVPVTTGGHLGLLEVRRVATVEWVPVCSNGHRSLLCVRSKFMAGPDTCQVLELDKDRGKVGVLPTDLGTDSVVEAFSGATSGLIVCNPNTGTTRMFTSSDAVAQSRMSGARVVWMATVARAIQHRPRAPPSRSRCVVQ